MMNQPNRYHPPVPCMWTEFDGKGKVILCSADPKHPVIESCDSFDQANKIMSQIIFGERIL